MCAYVEIPSAADDPRFGSHAILRAENDQEKHILKKTFRFAVPLPFQAAFRLGTPTPTPSRPV